MTHRSESRDRNRAQAQLNTVGIADIISTSRLRLDLVDWYTSGFE